MDERGAIARLFAPLATHPGAADLTDDAAVITPPPGHDLVITADAIVAGVHMFADDAAADIAHKAMHVNLSDLAAKGATPYGVLVTLSLSPDCDEAWLSSFADGLSEVLTETGCALLGGDTVRSNTLSVSITALGLVPTGQAVRRHGASAGDLILVSGAIGGGARGLLARQGAVYDERALAHYLRPRARLALAPLVREWASAAMDVSDGLVGDLDALLSASGVTATVNADTVPLFAPPDAAVGLEKALTGGDDYELLVTAPPEAAARLTAEAERLGERFTAIGVIEDGHGPTRFVREDGAELVFGRRAYSHL